MNNDFLRNINIEHQELNSIEAIKNDGSLLTQLSKSETVPLKYEKEKGTTCFNCPIEDCTMLYNTEEELEKHKLEHKSLVYCSFDNCNKSFINIINLKKHYKSHFLKQKIHCCPFPGCNKKFTESYNLTIHYRHHTGDKPYACERCGQRFFDRTNYKYHVSVKHNIINMKDIVCQHKGCNRKSKTSKQRLMHHNILEPECKIEKNNLLNILISFQQTINNILKKEDQDINDQNIIFGNLEEDNEFKEEIEDIQKQSKVLFNNIVDKDQYKGIVGNY